MKTQIFILLAVVSILVCNVRADLIWNSGHHEFTGGNEGEIYMYNDATADITGGTIGILWGQDSSSINVFEGSTIGLLRPDNFSTATIYGGVDRLFVLGDTTTKIYGGAFPNGISANDSAVIDMYVTEYNWDPQGGDGSDFGLLTGTWFDSGEAFSIDYIALDAFDHMVFVPEPSMLLLLGMGGLMLRYKK